MTEPTPPTGRTTTTSADRLAAEQDDELLYQIRVTLTYHLSDHIDLPPEQRADVSSALTDAITPDIRKALAVARNDTDRLRRQVLGYRGMKDAYLRERNIAQADLLEAEQIIERLCDAQDITGGTTDAR